MTDDAYEELRRFASANSMVGGKRRPVPIHACLVHGDVPRLIPGDGGRFLPEIFVSRRDLDDLDRRLYTDAAFDRGTDGRHSS